METLVCNEKGKNTKIQIDTTNHKINPNHIVIIWDDTFTFGIKGENTTNKVKRIHASILGNIVKKEKATYSSQ